jgi:hypothetical protein
MDYFTLIKTAGLRVNVPFTNKPCLVIIFLKFFCEKWRLRADFTIEIEDSVDMAVLAGHDGGSTGRADGVIAEGISEKDPLVSDTVNIGCFGVVFEVGVVSRNRLRSMVIAKNKNDVGFFLSESAEAY